MGSKILETADTPLIKHRKQLLGVPVDEITLESALKLIEQFSKDAERHQIVLLTTMGLLKARRDIEYARMLKEASLILPISKGLITGASFLKIGHLSRFRPFEFLIRTLSLLEQLNKTVYLIGAKKEDVEQSERNLRASFPSLRIVGRFSGYFSKEQEKNIILVIKKSSPTLLIVGTGLPGREKWILRHKKEFNPGIYLWADNCFEIFSGKDKQPSKLMFSMGLERLTQFKKKPWIVLNIFPFIYYLILLSIHKIFKK